MEVQKAYNDWASQYDSNDNKTRDLEKIALRTELKDIHFKRCLEIGCGTGKNTEWLVTRAEKLVSVDLSEEMLKKAKAKIDSDRVQFVQADINSDWDFVGTEKFDLASFSLVLEHIENLHRIFERLAKVVGPNGHVYIGELHPFKQYSGTKARFETEDGIRVVICFNHHVSDFTRAAREQGFRLLELNEYFDEGNRDNIPRILTLLFRKGG